MILQDLGTSLIATKSVWQKFTPTEHICDLMKIFRLMVNECIRIGLEHNVSTLKKLSQISYVQLSKYRILSYYKLHAISKAAGILASRKKSIKRDVITKTPYLSKPLLISCYGFKIVGNVLKIPIGNEEYFVIELNDYIMNLFSDTSVKIRSFVLTYEKICICYSKQVMQKNYVNTVGIDRNLRNVTVGNYKKILQYDLSKTIDIIETNTDVIKSFKRSDDRIHMQIAQKYGKRRKNRIGQILHCTSKKIVEDTDINKTVLVFEDIRGIRNMYQRRSQHGSNYRRKMNSWSFSEIKKQIEYKASWTGIPIIQLTRSETRGTSSLCPRCGERLQVGHKKRTLWCTCCKKEMDRDVIAAMNLSYKGLARLASSKGVASETVMRKVTEPLILRVDATKSMNEFN